MFPSPYGDYGSYHAQKFARCYKGVPSFRPLTGIMVLIEDVDGNIADRFNGCFRPLTGIMVLIACQLSGYVADGLPKFPSPYGDYGSYPHPL